MVLLSPEQASLLHLCHKFGLQHTDKLYNGPPLCLCHRLCQLPHRSSMDLQTCKSLNKPSKHCFMAPCRKHVYTKTELKNGCLPCGPGKPLDGQPNGCPSIPRMVYSCSMPNQGCWSNTISITFLHVPRRLVSAKNQDAHIKQCTVAWARYASVTFFLKDFFVQYE